MKTVQYLLFAVLPLTGARAAASLFGFYPQSTNSSLFAHRTSFDYGFGTELVKTNTCVSSNLVNHNVQFKIDGVQQIWGRFYLDDYNSAFCVMGYNGAECLDQYLQVMDNWTSSSTSVEDSEFGSAAAFNFTTTARSAKVVAGSCPVSLLSDDGG